MLQNNVLSFSLIEVVLISLVFNMQDVSSINSVLDMNGTHPYLINKTTGQLIEPRDYMNFDNIYTPDETHKKQQTAQGRNYYLLKAFDFANYYQSDYWHYSNEEELRLSAYPVANKDKCAQNLDWIERQLNISETVLFKQGEQHVNLMTLVDSFGKPEASTYLGHGHWLGSYYECTKVSIDMNKFELEECESMKKPINKNESGCQLERSKLVPIETSNFSLKTRYCIGKARDVDWPSEHEDNYVPRVSYKVGLCLPEACETSSFARHQAQIERLMVFNMPHYLKSSISLHEIYCLPDNRSPIRALGLSARIFLTICAIWLLAIIVATWVYSCYKRDIKNIIIAEQLQRDLEISQQVVENFKLKDDFDKHSNLVTNGSLDDAPDAKKFIHYVEDVRQPSEMKTENKSSNKNLLSNGAQLIMIKKQVSLALKPIKTDRQISCADQLDGQSNSSYQSSSSSLATWLNESPLTIKIIQALSIKENMKEFQEPPLLLREPNSSKKVRINLNALDSIKCFCCIIVIWGHTVFINISNLSNIIHSVEQSNKWYPRILMSFFNFVDTFFIISGMLTAYFVFKRFNKETFGKPLVWLSISLLRLIRLSPIYVLVFWFTKTLTVHLSDGPIWDYGTDKNSLKGLCINDHWWKSILYLGNLGTMQPLCILPAWSIILDAQYSLIIPPLLFLILRHKRMGYVSLWLAVVVSTASMTLQLANQTAVKTNDLAKARFHVYPLISRFAAEFYNSPLNRIGPVAIGIMGGHMLYLYDLRQIRRWPWFMRGATFKFILFMHLFILMLPTIGKFTDDPESTKKTDMTLFVFNNSTVKPIWSLINTILLLRLVTDLRSNSIIARLMSHNIWHCLGKLCFASYLVHYEVIVVLLKSKQEGLTDLTWLYLEREFCFIFLISTIIAFFLYIIFEAPINRLVMLFFAKPNYNQNKNNYDLNRDEFINHNDQSIVKYQNHPEITYSMLDEQRQITLGNDLYQDSNKSANQEDNQSSEQVKVTNKTSL